MTSPAVPCRWCARVQNLLDQKHCVARGYYCVTDSDSLISKSAITFSFARHRESFRRWCGLDLSRARTYHDCQHTWGIRDEHCDHKVSEYGQVHLYRDRDRLAYVQSRAGRSHTLSLPALRP